MSSLTRRMQRAQSPKRKPNKSTKIGFGTMLGVNNPRDKTKVNASAVRN